jgi:hypothetical protein
MEKINIKIEVIKNKPEFISLVKSLGIIRNLNDDQLNSVMKYILILSR